MIRFRIGKVTATLVQEMVDDMFDFLEFFPLATPAAVDENLSWMAPGHYVPATGRMLLSMHAWLLDTGRHKILIDGCVGNDKERPGRPDWCGLSTPFLDRLAGAGARPEDIDFVLCTHLHADHVGWNTRLVGGRWVPTFPNARYVFSRREHAYWEARLAADGKGPHLLAYQDSVLPVIEAGQALIVDDHAEIADCLVLEPAPGHTPGHVAIWLKSDGERAVLTGDILHHPIQVKYPAWSCFGCIDQKQSAETRKRVLEATCERRALLLPGHFMPPHAAFVDEGADGFKLRFAASDA
ncbi:MBL fold metallo-hydrolase [Chitinasiproducens palmae]|uniref:Metallo-beta-lactamase superfamily protein n=1 Tax=Chitinasiproducens palmae TaxID=1770053 RepID=A0A1H2PW34_9BURK|nr:MBL fold metallo-hydrolase [Chitinasiproducens palmae]SDV51548.1 Metallo-beta-lactamase superfamily protein [Chitinasiproducens palmae]